MPDYLILWLGGAGVAAVVVVAYALALTSRPEPRGRPCKHKWLTYHGPGGGARCVRCGDHAPEICHHDWRYVQTESGSGVRCAKCGATDPE